MYSLGLLAVELETARRRLLYVFEVPDGTPTSGLGTQPIPDGPYGRTSLSPGAFLHASGLPRRSPTKVGLGDDIDQNRHESMSPT
jgi:hypothetical protein